jgi:hypothetical protein
MERDPEVTVGVIDRSCLAQDFHLDAEFFPHLSSDCLGRGLARIHLSTREFPQATQKTFFGTAGDQQ